MPGLILPFWPDNRANNVTVAAIDHSFANDAQGNATSRPVADEATSAPTGRVVSNPDVDEFFHDTKGNTSSSPRHGGFD